MLLPESRQLLRAHAGLTARTFQNIIDHIDFGDFVSVCQPDAADFALPQQVIGRVAADAQHGLQILDRYNVRVLRKHELVHFSDFFTLHSHQAKMLKAAVSGNNCIITSGTGSGKTESFLLPLFAQLTKELDSWEEPADRIPTQDSWWKERSLGGLTP